ncbi:MAG: OmpA family protein [Flavobacterium sp.]
MKKYYILFLLFFSVVKLSAQQKFEVYFDFNKEVPNEASVKDFQKWISENTNADISKIYGYCDSVDDKSYNKELSAKRISNVIQILRENNIELTKKTELKPFGKDFKQSENQNENRKVVIFYTLKNVPKNTIVTNEEIPSSGDLKSKIETERSTLTSKFKNAKKGDLIKIENIYFYLNSDRIVEKSMPLLSELYAILIKNPKLKMEIQGHICCNTNPGDLKLSTQRAQCIYAYLLEKEIFRKRLSYKGFGSSKPVYKIPEKNEIERLANRRVEILIVAN